MRLLGITLPEEKRLDIGLTALFGIGRPLARKILDQAKVAYNLKPKDLDVNQENEIKKLTLKFFQFFLPLIMFCRALRSMSRGNLRKRSSILRSRTLAGMFT